jgi:hypothetical protein
MDTILKKKFSTLLQNIKLIIKLENITTYVQNNVLKIYYNLV